MSTIVYSETIQCFESTSQAIEHFSSKHSTTSDGKLTWGITIGIGGLALICYVIYLSTRKNTSAKEENNTANKQANTKMYSSKKVEIESNEEQMNEIW